MTPQDVSDSISGGKKHGYWKSRTKRDKIGRGPIKSPAIFKGEKQLQLA